MVPPNPLIHSMALWNNSGVFIPQTKRGKVITITIDAKTLWTANRNPGGGGHYDARGWLGHPAHYSAGYKCPGRNEGCLVVKIDTNEVMMQLTFDSPTVSVSSGKVTLTFDIAADITGSLLMGINDTVAVGDNDGILKILDVTWTERPR